MPKGVLSEPLGKASLHSFLPFWLCMGLSLRGPPAALHFDLTAFVIRMAAADAQILQLCMLLRVLVLFYLFGSGSFLMVGSSFC